MGAKKNSTPADIEPCVPHNTMKMKIHQYDLNGKYIKTYDSIADAQRAMSPRGLSVYRAAKGALKTAYGYQWRKAE